jgi:hypothetical protein
MSLLGGTLAPDRLSELRAHKTDLLALLSVSAASEAFASPLAAPFGSLS